MERNGRLAIIMCKVTARMGINYIINRKQSSNLGYHIHNQLLKFNL